jgi:preprotein translocase subunit SecY
MPIIFAQSILMFPQPIFWLANWIQQTPFLRIFSASRRIELRLGFIWFIYALMILFFSYFWVATQFNEIQIADDLKKERRLHSRRASGAGHERLSAQAMSRITLAGAIFLTVIATIPIILSANR